MRNALKLTPNLKITMQDINPKKAGKKRKSSIDVSPYLWPTNSKAQNNIHKKSTDVLIFPNF